MKIKKIIECIVDRFHSETQFPAVFEVKKIINGYIVNNTYCKNKDDVIVYMIKFVNDILVDKR